MKRFNLMIVTMGVLLFALAIPCLAADQVDQASSFAIGLVAFLSDVVFPLLYLVLSILASAALAWLAKKFKVDALTQQEARLHQAIWHAIGYAEEQAAKRIKASGVKLSSHEKLNVAVGKVLEAFPKIDPEKLRPMIESRLPFGKGTGATGEQVIG